MCNHSNLVLSDGIGCDHCIKWFHPTSMCTGLKNQTIKVIQRDGDVCLIIWFVVIAAAMQVIPLRMIM